MLMVIVSCTLDLTLPTNPIITARLSRGQLLLRFSHPMRKDGYVFFLGQTTNGDTWVLKTANQVGNPGQAAFTAGHLRSLLNYHFPAMTDVEYDLPVITIPPNIQTRRIQQCGVASSSLLTEIECL